MKSIMSQIFRHAQRHELIPAAIDKDGKPTNPVLLAMSKSGSNYEAVVVSPEQMMVILCELDTPETPKASSGLRAIAACRRARPHILNRPKLGEPEGSPVSQLLSAKRT